MWFINEVSRGIEGAESAFRWAAGLVGDVPLLGERLEAPFMQVATWLDLAGYNLRQTSREWDKQADAISKAIRDITSLTSRSLHWLDWSQIDKAARSQWPILKDPIGYLWPKTLDKIESHFVELRDLPGSIKAGAKAYLQSDLPWLFSPIEHLYPLIEDKLTSKHSWFRDPYGAFWNYTKDHFGDFFWLFLDRYGDKFIDTLGVIIDRFWYGQEEPE